MKKSLKKRCIIIHGPTGVGKSDAALDLALQYNGHIINGDVGQFYTPLTIGTAKPNWRHEKVPHHLFDLIDTPYSYTVVEYRQVVLAKMEELWDQGILPIIVGGSGFYLRSLFFPPCQEEQGEQVVIFDDELSWEKLNTIDAERAQTIDPQDRYRIERALQIIKSGKQSSACVPVYQDVGCDVLLLWFERDRQELYDRINKRVVHMMDQGWLQEVESLSPEWHNFLMHKKIIGYDLLIAYHHDTLQEPLESVIEVVAKKTRNYAKRQHTFWRMFKKTLEPHLQSPSKIEEISLSQQDSYTLLTTLVDRFIKEAV